MDQLESFETKRFVQRLLGKGDVGGLMGKIQEAIPEDRQPELLDTINKARARTWGVSFVGLRVQARVRVGGFWACKPRAQLAFPLPACSLPKALLTLNGMLRRLDALLLPSPGLTEPLPPLPHHPHPFPPHPGCWATCLSACAWTCSHPIPTIPTPLPPLPHRSHHSHPPILAAGQHVHAHAEGHV